MRAVACLIWTLPTGLQNGIAGGGHLPSDPVTSINFMIATLPFSQSRIDFLKKHK